jgi:diguanylate cyclase (GGDEF)-like protein
MDIATFVAVAGWLTAMAVGLGWWQARRQARQARLEASAAQARLQQVFDHLDIGLVVYDADDRLCLWNADFAGVYPTVAPLLKPGMRFEELLRRALANGCVAPPPEDPEAWIAERLRQHRTPHAPLLRALPGDRWRRITERRLPDGGMLSYSVDVTQLVQQEQALREAQRVAEQAIERLSLLTETDALTGIANRLALNRHLAEECARVRRHGFPLSVLLIDIDHFKAYNDSYGHAAGDDCLRRVAQLLAGCTRRPGDLAARLGGEEFVLLLPHMGAAMAAAHAEECLRAVSEAAIPHAQSSVAPHVTLSIGVACSEGLPTDFDPASLLAHADAAMYRAKRSGRHSVSAG